MFSLLRKIRICQHRGLQHHGLIVLHCLGDWHAEKLAAPRATKKTVGSEKQQTIQYANPSYLSCLLSLHLFNERNNSEMIYLVLLTCTQSKMDQVDPISYQGLSDQGKLYCRKHHRRPCRGQVVPPTHKDLVGTKLHP